MEFFCVLSVEGLLATYLITKESDLKYSAVFRPTNGKRTDIPARISLERGSDDWQADPWHDEIVKGLINAIETNNR